MCSQCFNIDTDDRIFQHGPERIMHRYACIIHYEPRWNVQVMVTCVTTDRVHSPSSLQPARRLFPANHAGRSSATSVIICRVAPTSSSCTCNKQSITLWKHTSLEVEKVRICFIIHHSLVYTVSQKNVPLCNCPYLWQILANFRNSFTRTLFGQFAIKQLLNIPPHHNCVATLPCEI